MTTDDLMSVMRAAAGQDENVDLDGDILDVPFADLGYDSLALLETAARLEREHGVRLTDDLVTTARTPRGFLALVNEGLEVG
ncbi:acyl carrier protein [Streptomyces tagetis]|uniref:Acyl carrier protein n=1 Tax=Streptomyces tagetis TaxID=2820809 RepID=A0A940XBH8_9ACTN|nr:acyl carrier protein [Streptomyces sp. RG38]MBQ0825061.1 acyl carrier protein [Streptomyces sp. RG38]